MPFTTSAIGPGLDCALCPRLCEFRIENKKSFPDKFNAPVPGFGNPQTARLLIVGLAPGLRGANFSGRPFTGDFAGEILYSTLLRFGFARGIYGARKDDGLTLIDTCITNAVRCVPPQNKPLPDEIKTCRSFLEAEIASMPRLKVIVTLGTVSHNSTLRALDEKPSHFKFAHGAVHATKKGITVVNTYHSSRYNVNTGRLTPTMFDAIFKTVRALLVRQYRKIPSHAAAQAI